MLSIHEISGMIHLEEVGARAGTPNHEGVPAYFGVYLPGIEQHNGYQVKVRVIHKKDRFDPSIPPFDHLLTQVQGSNNNLWKADFTIPYGAGGHFGQAGTYLYRYQLLRTLPGQETPVVVTEWFADPFARTTDVGELAAVITADALHSFTWTDDAWKVPEITDLVVYELQVEEFNNTFDGVIERIPYLQSLGVNCLELMPVTSVKLDFDRGYGPLHYFAPHESWGGVLGLKRLVNECHKAGIAVILDMVYQHVDPAFAYCQVYQDARIESPMIDGNGPFGPQIDFSRDFAREYVKEVNKYWLHEYHVDGFRYDQVTESFNGSLDLFDGPTGQRYAKIAYDAYIESLGLPRFTPSGLSGEHSRIIQCAETLSPERSRTILEQTFTNSVWQDGLLDMVENMIWKGSVDANFVPQLLLDPQYCGYPSSKWVQDRNGNPVEMPVMPFQYLDDHDHSYLITFTRQLLGEAPFGDRDQFYKLQPFAIALYTCVGVPMLWQGQEFADNYMLPDEGNERICYRRDVHWEYFYDREGKTLVQLYRKLGQLRRDHAALRSREAFYYEAESRVGDGIVAYCRRASNPEQVAIVFLNFSNDTKEIAVPFPVAGAYKEMINEDYTLTTHHDNESVAIHVPSHFGYIFMRQ